MEAQEWIICHGHPLVQGTHPTTFEVTTAANLTAQGDCIIGVGADKGARDLDPVFRDLLARDDAYLLTVLRAGPVSVEIHGRGSRELTLRHPADLVWRRSGFTCDRTVAIAADCTARLLPRELIRRLQRGDYLEVELRVTVPDGTVP
ncbi:MAG: DUF371 domain-containing protein [Methanomicrobiales archaeon]|nr:DUF371 domain-containing protein [Methanomicrobiales archaeon]